MKVNFLRCGFFGMVLGLLTASTSLACVCGDTRPTVAEARDNALMVFSGRLVETEYRGGAFDGGKAAGAELTAHFKIERWWKGEPLPDIFLFVGRYQSADYSIRVVDCAYQFEVGKRYLVYAGFFLGRLRASYCSRTSEIDKAAEDLKWLGRGRSPVNRRRAS